MVTDDKPTGKRRYRRLAFIPAGVLIGLGVGLLLNYPGAGVLIGLGLGFIATSFMRREIPDSSAAPMAGGVRRGGWWMFFVGIVMILMGLWLVWRPFLTPPYLIAIVLILLGIGFVLRGFHK
jgi:uncharacterized membrane protein HdeD (DUF308 family)